MSFQKFQSLQTPIVKFYLKKDPSFNFLSTVSRCWSTLRLELNKRDKPLLIQYIIYRKFLSLKPGRRSAFTQLNDQLPSVSPSSGVAPGTARETVGVCGAPATNATWTSSPPGGQSLTDSTFRTALPPPARDRPSKCPAGITWQLGESAGCIRLAGAR